MIKKVFYLVLVLAAVLFFASNATSAGFLKNVNFWKRSVCDKPLAYSIGNIDKRFDLSNEQIRKDLTIAENIWEKPTGKNLFQQLSNLSLFVHWINQSVYQ